MVWTINRQEWDSHERQRREVIELCKSRQAETATDGVLTDADVIWPSEILSILESESDV